MVGGVARRILVHPDIQPSVVIADHYSAIYVWQADVSGSYELKAVFDLASMKGFAINIAYQKQSNKVAVGFRKGFVLFSLNMDST